MGLQVKCAHLVTQREVTVEAPVTALVVRRKKTTEAIKPELAGKSDTQKHSADYRCVMVLTQTDHNKAGIERG